MPSTNDPYGEYTHVKPVPLEQAAHEMQIAVAQRDHMRSAITIQQQHIRELQARFGKLEQAVAEKEYQLKLSAQHTHIPS